MKLDNIYKEEKKSAFAKLSEIIINPKKTSKKILKSHYARLVP